MAFKLRSPLHNEPELPVANDGSNKFKKYQASLKNTYMSSKDSGVGAYPDPQTGERTFYDKKHQSYDVKKGVTNKTGSFKGGEYVMNKPKAQVAMSKSATATKSKSPYPAAQGGTPLYNTNNTDPSFKEAISVLTSDPKKKAASDNMKAKNTNYVDINKMRADANAEQQKKIDANNNKVSNSNNTSSNASNTKLLTNKEREKMLADSKGKTNFSEEVNKINKSEKIKQLKKKVNNNKGGKNTSTNKNTKPIKSHDSDKGGYKSNMTTAEFFGRDYSKELANSIAPMPKFERTVTNARSADHNIIGSKPMSKRDRIIRRQNIRTENKRERVGNQIERIKGRQARKGINIAKKDLKRSDEYVNKGYSSIVDTKQNKPSSSSSSGFQDLSKIGAPKPTQKKTKQPGTAGSTLGVSTKSTSTSTKPTSTSTKGIRPNITVQSPSIINDDRIKKGAKEAKGGRINEKVSAKTYESLTGFAKLTKKAGPSGGMQRGMPKSSTSITQPNSGPRTKNIKVESGPNKRTKFIMNAYNNIRSN